MFLPFQTSEKCHWITHVLSGGIDFCVFLNKFFYQPSLFYQSMLLEGGGCCMSNFSFTVLGGGCCIILHCSVIVVFLRKQLLYPHSLFWEGIDSSIKMGVHICSLPSSFTPVPFHTLRKSYSTIRSLLMKRLNPLCLVKRLLYHPSLLYHSIL